ncbi:MAG: type II 3-dehydroquinate dehydratase [Flavobacteriaceae bacterium]
MKWMIINGPNINLLGKREPEVYGNKTFADYLAELKTLFPEDHIAEYQSNIEGALIDMIQQSGFEYDGIILNAAAYTHTSVGIADAVKAVPAPVVEVHISNTHAREDFRKDSFLSPVVHGVILGFGLDSYRLAIMALKNITR